MRRNALLIGNTEGLEGVAIDVENTSRFLQSSRGGEWDRSEITKFFNPKKDELIRKIEDIKRQGTDYFLFLFTGHGCYYGQTEIQLNIRETVPESIINFVAHRQLSIFDCCRVEKQATVMDSALESIIKMESYRSSTREKYNQRIMQAAQQHAKLYSCQKGEVSYDTPNGARYLTNLLGSAITRGYEAFKTVEDAHDAARTKTINESRLLGQIQNPTASMPKLPKDYQLILSVNG